MCMIGYVINVGWGVECHMCSIWYNYVYILFMFECVSCVNRGCVLIIMCGDWMTMDDVMIDG